MASRAVTPPSSPRRWSGSRARTCLRCASRQAPTRSPLLSRRPTTSWLRPPPTVTCPLHLLLRRRELRRIPRMRTSPLRILRNSHSPALQTVRGRRAGDEGPSEYCCYSHTRANSFQPFGGALTLSERKTSKNRVDSTLPPVSWAPNVLYQWACSSVACIASSLSHRVTVSILPFSLSPNSQSPR